MSWYAPIPSIQAYSMDRMRKLGEGPWMNVARSQSHSRRDEHGDGRETQLGLGGWARLIKKTQTAGFEGLYAHLHVEYC